jgi:hypothetical protein
MYITDRRQLQNTWHGNMTSEEKDIYLCNMRILNTQQYQEDDSLLSCFFGLSQHLIEMNTFHRDSESAAIKRFEELTNDRDK